MASDLRNRTVLITGASGGIGHATAEAFARVGSRVILHCHKNVRESERLAKALPRDSAIPLSADLSRESEVTRLFEQASTWRSPIHVLVANAGIWPAEHCPVHEMDVARWQRTIDVNLTSAFLCAREFIRQVIRHGVTDPAIVFVASTAGMFGEAGHADYATSKSPLVSGLMLSLKNEIVQVAPRGRVNTVSPGWTVTPMTKDSLTPSAIEQTCATMALKKIAEASDIAAAIVFLASSETAGHITGQNLAISGGMEGRLLHTPA